MRKILGFTSIRSDYDLMKGLYKKLQEDEDIEFKIAVSGAHLSSTYGMSINQVEKDGFDILCKIESLLDANSSSSRIKSASIMMNSLIDYVSQYSPDILIYAGDREDVIVYALIGGYLQIPTIHFFGGDHVIDGHIDNPVRHATSKLSSFHMVCTQSHKNRLLKMGEDKSRIEVIGAVSLDRFYSHTSIPKGEIFKKMGVERKIEEYALVIFHPQDLEKEKSHIYLTNILEVLKNKKLFSFVSFPNTDPGNRKLQEVINQMSSNSQDFYFYKNLESDLFLSLFKNASIQVGNSSAGIVESGSIPIPVVNVGLRQVGREANDNVIFCGTDYQDIREAIDLALSSDFRKRVSKIKNLYGDGNSIKKAYDIIKKTDFNKFLYKTEDPLNTII